MSSLGYVTNLEQAGLSAFILTSKINTKSTKIMCILYLIPYLFSFIIIFRCDAVIFIMVIASSTDTHTQAATEGTPLAGVY